MVDLEEFVEEAIPLMAADLRFVRRNRGMTTARAAKQAELATSRYRALEQGRVAKNRHTVAELISVARHLGLQSLRLCFAEEVGQYVSMDLSADERQTFFIDMVEADIRELKEQGYFVSPYSVLALLDSMGLQSTLESRKAADKQAVELLIGAVFTLFLGQENNYYIGLAREDPPDVQVVVIDANGDFSLVMVEIAQYGKWSRSLFEVIRKKLAKRYQEGTVLVVLVEETECVPITELGEIIRTQDLHAQRIFVIGGGGPRRVKAVTWELSSSLPPVETAWVEMEMGAEQASKGHLGYEGIVFKPPGRRMPIAHPVFVRKMNLRR